jgi:hypothetical protein
MSAGFHLDVFNFAGVQAVAEGACEMGLSLNFVPPPVSAGLGLLLNLRRSHEVGRAEKLVAEMVVKMRGPRGSLLHVGASRTITPKLFTKSGP